MILSIGPNGCTLTCDHCQNWNISQEDCPVTYIPPEELAAAARSRGSVGVAFTYTEPLLWYEYLIDVLPLLREEGLKSVLVTNGYLNDEPAARIAQKPDSHTRKSTNAATALPSSSARAGVSPSRRHTA